MLLLSISIFNRMDNHRLDIETKKSIIAHGSFSRQLDVLQEVRFIKLTGQFHACTVQFYMLSFLSSGYERLCRPYQCTVGVL